MLCQGISEKRLGVSAAMELCKSRLRLCPMVSLLRQGFPSLLCVSSGGSNSSLSPLALACTDAGSRLCRVRIVILRDQARSVRSDDQVEVTGLFATQDSRSLYAVCVGAGLSKFDQRGTLPGDRRID